MTGQMWILIVCTILLWGATPILEKYGLRYTDEFTGVFIRSVGIAIILVVIFTIKGKWAALAKVPPRALIFFTLSGLMAGLLAMWTYYKVLRINPSTKIVPLVAIYPLVTAIFGVIIAGENVSWQRILGTILIILGVLLVK